MTEDDGKWFTDPEHNWQACDLVKMTIGAIIIIKNKYRSTRKDTFLTLSWTASIDASFKTNLFFVKCFMWKVHWHLVYFTFCYLLQWCLDITRGTKYFWGQCSCKQLPVYNNSQNRKGICFRIHQYKIKNESKSIKQKTYEQACCWFGSRYMALVRVFNHLTFERNKTRLWGVEVQCV